MAKHNHYEGGLPARNISQIAQPYHVFIASPTSRGFPAAYNMSLVATIETLVRFGVKFDYHVLDGDCHVDDARNKVFREFLETDCTDLFFIDSDMGWRAEAFLKLLKVEGDIVGGIYRHKNDLETYPFHPGVDCPRTSAEDGLFEMPKIPTGFMRIRRHVIEELYKREAEKSRIWWDSPEDEATGRRAVACICERAFAAETDLSAYVGDKTNRQSGDLVLCLKARAAGFTVRADVDLQFAHVGEKEWIGHCATHLRMEQNVDHPAFIAAVNELKAGNTADLIFKRINDHSYLPLSALPGEALSLCWETVRSAQGDAIEFGSGISTLVMGLALKGTSKVLHTIESDLDWFKRTCAMLDRHGVENVVMHYCPLVPYDGFDWYGVDGLEMGLIDVVIIDGPERTKAQRDACFKIIPDVMANATHWIIDDMGDPGLQAMLKENSAGRAVTWFRATSDNTEHRYVIASLPAEIVEGAETTHQSSAA